MSPGYHFLLLIVDNINYYNKYYVVNTSQFCKRTISEIRKGYNRTLSSYTCENICSDDLLNNQNLVIFYKCIRFVKCKKDLFQKKYRNFIQKFYLERTNQNVYKSEKYIINKNFILSEFGIKMKESKIKEIGKDYCGIHIRTYGYFKDFSEYSKQIAKKFDIDGFKVRVIQFYDILTVKTVYLISDSIKMKYIIKEIINKNITLHFRNKTSIHNRNSKKEIDEYTFIDLELLSEAKMALLTEGSTFSILVYMRNINCNIMTCFFFKGLLE